MQRKPATARRALFALALACLFMAACGGGSSGGSAPPPPVATPPPPPPPLGKAELVEASRFAARASFGLSMAAIEALAREGNEAWLQAQFDLPTEAHSPVVTELIERREAGDFADVEEGEEFLFMFRRIAWWHRAVTAEDTLRQRVAFALSEIFVVSDNVDTLIVHPYALADYYDMLLVNAFGNFRDLLRDVTLHPAMGVYLSHLNNRKSDPINNIFPDENYAREVMQLFSIGLFELNVDGSRRLDGDGNPLPTYGNDEIREFAKIFTGLSYGGPDAFFGRQEPYFRAPMQMFDDFHESGEKRLLGGAVVPAGQTGEQDIEDAIDNLFMHPNVGPFIGRQLIQRLVTSNPSPAYVERVARAFNGDSTGVRGDMQAVIRAVLLDPEAQAATDSDRSFGKLREPVTRYLALLRQFEASSRDGFIANSGYLLQELGRQHPLSAPSVFNFFLPQHSPAGEIANADLVAPEFEILTSTAVINFSNLLDYVVSADFVTDLDEPFETVTLDLQPWIDLAEDPEELVEQLDVLLTYGTLSDETREVMLAVLGDLDDAEFRARTAIYLFLVSPDYAVRI